MNNEKHQALIIAQKQEKASLQKKIQQLKQNVPLNDKKNRKEIMGQILLLEENLRKKHVQELDSIKNSDNLKEKMGEIEILPGKKESRAQRRKDKKELSNNEKQQEIDADNLRNAHLIKEIESQKEHEMQSIEDKLAKMNACLYQISPDGDCLYNSIAHQMRLKTGCYLDATGLRKMAANYLRENRALFSPFMPDLNSADDFYEYCDAVSSTNVWGGQVEIQALSQALKKQIDVIQADAPTLHIGQEFQQPDSLPLTISYHRHLYSLGEHYNSVCNSTDQ